MTYSDLWVRPLGLFKYSALSAVLLTAAAEAQTGSSHFNVEVEGQGNVGGVSNNTAILTAGTEYEVAVDGLVAIRASCGADIFVREQIESYDVYGEHVATHDGVWYNKGAGTSFYKGQPPAPQDPPEDPNAPDPQKGVEALWEKKYFVILEAALPKEEEDDSEEEGGEGGASISAAPRPVARGNSCCDTALGTTPGFRPIEETSVSGYISTDAAAVYEFPLGRSAVGSQQPTEGVLVFRSALNGVNLANEWHDKIKRRTISKNAPGVLNPSPVVSSANERAIFVTARHAFEIKWQNSIQIKQFPVAAAQDLYGGSTPSQAPVRVYRIRQVDTSFVFEHYEGNSATPYRTDVYTSVVQAGESKETWVFNNETKQTNSKLVATTIPTHANGYVKYIITSQQENWEYKTDQGAWKQTSSDETMHEILNYPWGIRLIDHKDGMANSRVRRTYTYDTLNNPGFWTTSVTALSDNGDVLVGSGATDEDYNVGSYVVNPWLDMPVDSLSGLRIRKLTDRNVNGIGTYGRNTTETMALFSATGTAASRYEPTPSGADILSQNTHSTREIVQNGSVFIREEAKVHHVFGRFSGGYTDIDNTEANWRRSATDYYARQEFDGTRRLTETPMPYHFYKTDIFRRLDRSGKVEEYGVPVNYLVQPSEAALYPVQQGPYKSRTTESDLNGGNEIWYSTPVPPVKVPFKSTRTVTVNGKNGAASETNQVWDGSGWATLNVRRQSFTNDGKLTTVTQDGVVIESRSYPDANTVVILDAVNGLETVEISDAAGNMVSRTKKGVPAASGYPTQPDVVTTVVESSVLHPSMPPPKSVIGIERNETTTSGGLSLFQSEQYSLDGERLASTDSSGNTTSYSTDNVNGQRVQTTSRANGAHTLSSTSYLDGRRKEEAGTGQPKRVFSYAVKTTAPKGIEETEKVIDGANEVIVARRLLTGDGELISETVNGVTSIYAYDLCGRVVKKTTGGRDYLYAYDYRNLVIREGYDVNADGQLTAGSTDTVIERDRYYQLDAGSWWLVDVQSTYVQDGNSTVKLTTTRREKQGTGASRISEVIYPDNVVETTTRTVSGRLVTTTVTSGRYPGRAATQVEYNGLLVSNQDFTQSKPVLYLYDALGRQIRATDTGAMQIELRSYDPQNGQMTSVLNGSSERTSYGYYPANDVNAGQTKWVQNNAGAKTYFAYNLRGQMTHQWGEAVHPLRYIYDGQGILKYLDTFPTQTPGAWAGETLPAAFGGSVYDRREFAVVDGRLQERTYGFGAGGVSYIYNADGSLQQRQWSNSGSGQTTTYTYAESGALKKIDYADSTPDVDATYDRSGRVATLSDASGVRSFAYQANGDVVTTYSGGLLSGLVLTKTHNSAGKVSGMSWSFGGEAHQAGYTYDSQMRLETATLGPVNGSSLVTAAYGYHPDTARVHTLTRPVTGSLPLVGTFLLDGEGRMDALSWKRGNHFYGGHDYKLNAAGLRNWEQRLDGSVLTYLYNSRGELTQTQRSRQGSSLPADWHHAYAYDDSGTRRSSTTPEGEILSHTLESVPSSTDTVYTSSGETKHWVRGRANSGAVTVNGSPAAQDARNWRSVVTKPTAGSSLEVTVVADRSTPPDTPDPVTQTLTLQPSTTQWKYDARGNLKEDGRWIYTWDMENRLVVQEQKYPGDVDAGAKPVKRLEFAYDAYGRRVSKTVLGNERAFNGSLVNGAWTFAKQTVFLWQDWTLVAEFVRTTPSGSLSLRRSYLWGLDVDGTLGGAGGVGGLLWVADHVPGIAGSNRQLAPCYDGNGNIMNWVENEGGQVLPLHRLEYDPYGRLLVEEEARVVRTKNQRDLGVTDEWLDRPAFGFSTKYEDVETGLLYYGYRYYAPEMGRWISRDPIGEDGGVNLYGMVGNDPVNEWDYLGLYMPMWPIYGPETNGPNPRFITEAALKKMIGGNSLDDRLIHHLCLGYGKNYKLEAKEAEQYLSETIEDWSKNPTQVTLIKAIREACINGHSVIDRQFSMKTGSKLLNTVEVMLKGEFNCARNGWNFEGTLTLIDEDINFNIGTSKKAANKEEFVEHRVRDTLTIIGAVGTMVWAWDDYKIVWTNATIPWKGTGRCE